MKNIKKLLISSIIASSIFVSPLFSQVESNEMLSNGYHSTARVIRGDIEDYIDVRYFNNVNFDKVFLTSNLSSETFNVGEASRVNDFYIATQYTGKFWDNLSGNTKKSNANINYGAPDNGTKFDIKNTNSNATGNSHNIIFLLGLPNKMGFKLDSFLNFNSNESKQTGKNSIISSSEIKDTNFESVGIINDPLSYPPTGTSTKNIDNEYNFNLLWSCFDIEKENVNIKPWVRVGVDMMDKRVITNQTYTTKYTHPNDSSKDYEVYNSVINTTYNDGHRPILNINLGSDFAFKNSSTFNQLLILDYGVTATLYGKNVSTFIIDRKVSNDPTRTSSEETVTTMNGRMDFTNSIKGTYKFDFKPTDKFTLAASAGLGTSVRAWSDGSTTEIKTRKDNSGTKITVNGKEIIDGDINKVVGDKTTGKNYHVDTIFTPTFALGMKYEVTPSFILNLGYSAKIPDVTIKSHTIDTKSTYTENDGTTTETGSNKTTDVTTTTGKYNSIITAGFSWLMGDTCTLNFGTALSRKENQESFNRAPSFSTLWNTNWNIDFSVKL